MATVMHASQLQSVSQLRVRTARVAVRRGQLQSVSQLRALRTTRGAVLRGQRPPTRPASIIRASIGGPVGPVDVIPIPGPGAPLAPNGDISPTDAATRRLNPKDIIDAANAAIDFFNSRVAPFIATVAFDLDKDGRSAFTQRLAQDVYDGGKGQFNVMVVNAKSNYYNQFNELEWQSTIEYPKGGGSYRVYVFKSGTFALYSDGGYLNWCFIGNFTRNGGRVDFRNP